MTDLSDMAFWDSTPAEREHTFRAIRAAEPISWQRQPDGVLMPEAEKSGGYWALLRYDDVREVSRDGKRFRSGAGVMFEDVPPELLEASQSILAMDDPRHARVRRLISAGFSPRNMSALEADIKRDAKTIVDELEPSGDAVEAIAKRLPLMTIMRMLGVEEADRERVVGAADAAVSWNDPEYLAGRPVLQVLGEAIGVMHQAAMELTAARRSDPREDVLSTLVHAEVDGSKLTDAEIAAFFVLLSVAGNDTTRHTTSHALLALTQHPDERALVVDHLDTAVEEFVRWASPVMTFRRTATEDTQVGGVDIEAGQKVVLFYPSANRDESAFDAPDRFDVRRDPNRHVGFGGGGPHFCMGAALARTQLRALFTELLTRHPDIEVGEPDYLVGNFVSGVKALPYELSGWFPRVLTGGRSIVAGMTPDHHLMTRRRALGASAGLIVAGGILRPPFDGDDYVAQAASCATLTAEQEEGPFYVDLNKVRENIVEGQAGLPLLFHITIVNTRTCKPLKHAAVDIWHCNASGVYSDISSENTVGETYLRGVQITGKHGTATFKTIFPGHYEGRTAHIHLKVHTGGHVAHTGQLFPTQAVYQEVYKLSPYAAETAAVVSHSQDRVWTQQHGAEALMKIHKAGHRLSKGLVAHLTLGVDPQATPAAVG